MEPVNSSQQGTERLSHMAGYNLYVSKSQPRLPLAKVLGLLLVGLLTASVAIFFNVLHEATPAKEHSPLYNKAIRLIETSADVLTKNGAAEILASVGSSSNLEREGNLSWPCTAAFTSADVIRSSDQQRAARYIAYGRQIADWEIAQGLNNRYHQMGWGINNNVYTYQDGAVGYCIANAYEQTKDAKYLAALTDEMRFFWPYFTTNIDPLCNNCGYWYDNPQNNEPFIKNMNMYMAQLVAKLYILTGKSMYKNRSIQTLNSEIYEINIRHELGYRGYAASTGHEIEEHMSVEIWGFAGLAHLLQREDSQYTQAIHALWSKWKQCGATCNSGDYNIPLVNCSLARDVGGAKDECQQFILSADNTDSIQLIGVIESLPAWG